MCFYFHDECLIRFVSECLMSSCYWFVLYRQTLTKIYKKMKLFKIKNMKIIPNQTKTSILFWNFSSNAFSGFNASTWINSNLLQKSRHYLHPHWSSSYMDLWRIMAQRIRYHVRFPGMISYPAIIIIDQFWPPSLLHIQIFKEKTIAANSKSYVIYLILAFFNCREAYTVTLLHCIKRHPRPLAEASLYTTKSFVPSENANTWALHNFFFKTLNASSWFCPQKNFTYFLVNSIRELEIREKSWMKRR